MKALGYIASVAGFILLAGSAGNADYYDACKAAADCVAGEPQSVLSTIAQLLGGVILMVGGMLFINASAE